MATKTSKYVVQFEADTKGAQKNVDALGDSFDSASDSSEGLQQGMSALDSFTGGFASKAKGAIGSIKGMTSGFKSMKVAIISTGIGALVVAVGSLFVYFTKTKRGAEALEKGMAWMEGLFGVITDQIAGFGETIVDAFNNPQQAVKDLWEVIKTNFINRLEGVILAAQAAGKVIQSALSFDWDEAKSGAEDFGKALIQMSTGLDEDQQKNIVDNVEQIGIAASKAADASLKLTAAQQKLDDSNRALNVSFSARRAEIKELNKIGEDTTKSDEERRAAIEKAIEIETELMAQRESNAARQVAIYKEQNALSESIAEDLDRVAEAEIELNRIKEESNELQTTLQNKLNTLESQSRLKKETEEKATADRVAQIAKDAADVKFALMEEGLQKELEVAQRKFDELELKAGENHELKKEIDDARQAELEAINEKYNQQEVDSNKAKNAKIAADDKQLRDLKFNAAKQSLETIGNLATLFAGKSEKSQKRAFEINKKVQIASALIDTYKSAVSAFNSLSSIPIYGTILGGIAAAAAVASGLANVKKIKSQKFQGGGDTGAAAKPNISLSGASQSIAEPPTPEAQSFETPENEPVQAYVVATEVQDSNEASQKIEDIATL